MMEFKQIIDEIRGIGFTPIRVENDDYFEGVIVKDKQTLILERLKKLLGEPLDHAGGKLPTDVDEVIKDFGGAREDQTLFFMKDDKFSYFAMLWPWSDGYHITIKVGLNKT